jgi:hypothetical protein
VKTDLNVYPVPPVALPPALGKYTDPVFGTEVMRVTANGGDSAYAVWPLVNKDSTRFLSPEGPLGQGGIFVYDLDPEGFALSNRRALPSVPGGVRYEGLLWSGLRPSVFYCVGNMAPHVFEVDVDSGAVKTLFSVDPKFYLLRPSCSRDDKRFGFILRDMAAGAQVGYGAWEVGKGFVWSRLTDAKSKCQIDRSGKFFVVYHEEQGAGVTTQTIVNLDTGAEDRLTDNEPDYGLGHCDLGYDFAVGADNWRNALTWRRLSDPHNHKKVWDFKGWGAESNGNRGGVHVSCAASDGWALVSTYGEPSATGLLDSEIFKVNENGEVRRYLHHRSTWGNNYYHSPRASQSPDGRFAAYVSDNGTGQYELMLAKLEAATTSPAPPPPPVVAPVPPTTPVVEPRDCPLTVSAENRVTAEMRAKGFEWDRRLSTKRVQYVKVK